MIIVGKLNHGMSGTSIGRQNSQKLHQMSYEKFLRKLKYKAETHCIQVIKVYEVYTSKRVHTVN
ncbi:hypothetical protein A4H02_05265 [Fervidobacterium thailandense]|uniref:Cas12f1-like TNB domain-containing protein n=1 Tax=Fervidobacterium thailandense TaxID=1008305 RepID=A0A1E3G2D0_9BACT|nr:hypothetical protein A4H02_05265 [Fervidobacterium thailandense]